MATPNYQQLFPVNSPADSISAAPAPAPKREIVALDLSAIEAITFDAGGTLVYAHPPVGEVYAAAAKKRGYEADPVAVHQRFLLAFKAGVENPRPRIDIDAEHRFWRDLVEKSLNLNLPQEVMDAIFAELWDGFASAAQWKLFDDAWLTVTTLRERGYRVFLLSNADSRFRRTFSELGFDPYFEQLFISAEIGHEKPAPQIFEHVQSAIGIEPGHILHIGDSAFHDGGAKACGWHVLILKQDIHCLSDLLNLLLGPTARATK
ncbi:MAG: HAD-IA family hydrolase [Verrucomicrobiota bacterium]|nr:HAD-IA family hydrolase [Verrucomicrobiota bacterium]